MKLSSAAITLLHLTHASGESVYDCDFEDDFCLFSNDCAVGSCKWFRLSGATPTGETGPSGAQQGVMYAYTKALGNSYRQFRLTLDPFNGIGVSFWYHMYGTYVGQLRLEASTDGGSTYATVWSKDGAQQASTTAPFKYAALIFPGGTDENTTVDAMRFVGYGTNAQSDIAIDDFEVMPFPSSAPTPLPSHPSPRPTAAPTPTPTKNPVPEPTPRPILPPTPLPTPVPTASSPPTGLPSPMPSPRPTKTGEPSTYPSQQPSHPPSPPPTRPPTQVAAKFAARCAHGAMHRLLAMGLMLGLAS